METSLWISHLLLIIAVNKVYGQSLPQEEADLESTVIQCGKGKDVQWKKTESVGRDIVVFYSCGGTGEQTRTLRCHNGYKAQYRRFIIPRPSKREVEGAEPNFGLFDYGNNPNVLDRAAIVYACLKP